MARADEVAGTAMTREPGMSRTQLELVPHDPSWAEWFAAESLGLQQALGSLALRIEHVGSTAVPDVLAKPIIDICIVVAGPSEFASCVHPLVGMGYRYRGQHGDDELRRYFVLDRGERRVAQLHLYAIDAPAWRAQLGFRDLLRARGVLRRAYEQEKLRVAGLVGGNKNEYAIQKGPFVEGLLKTEGLI